MSNEKHEAAIIKSVKIYLPGGSSLFYEVGQEDVTWIEYHYDGGLRVKKKNEKIHFCNLGFAMIFFP